MCGISGIVGGSSVANNLLNALKNLEYRGYDSCGMAIFNQSQIYLKKNIGTVNEVNAKEDFLSMQGNIGIAHTRWATHGKVSCVNSHPHFSSQQDFVIVHNGIFSNHQKIKNQLESKGIQFQSSTDSEIFAHLIAFEYEKDQSSEQAFVNALNQMQGAFAVCMMSIYDSETLFCAKYKSPLILGLGTEQNFIASDVNAFLEHTKQAITLNDGEYACVKKDSYSIQTLAAQQKVLPKIFAIEWNAETTQKGGYEHYMLKEIFEQSQTCEQVLQISKEEIQKLANALLYSRYNYLVGIGTTYYVAQFAQYCLAQLTQVHSLVISADEFADLAILEKEDFMLAISQSGETYDTRCALEYAKDHHTSTAAIVNVMGSTISQIADVTIMQGSGPEICVVSTKAAFAQMLILLRTAFEMRGMKFKHAQKDYEIFYDALQSFPLLIQETIQQQSQLIQSLVNQINLTPHWFFLGCGAYLPIAMESALKMKEVSYLHAEGMAAGFLKHGTLAMIDDSVNSLFFIPPPEQHDLWERTLIAIEQIKARQGFVIGLSFEHDQIAKQAVDLNIILPQTHVWLAPLLQLIASQLLSYYTAVKLNRNIDKPRNLAKSVTVK